MIELKKEFIIERTKTYYSLDKMMEITEPDNIIITNFHQLLKYIIKKEDLLDLIDSGESFLYAYHFIVKFFENEGIDLSDVIIEDGNTIYNEIIELIKEI